ncbi:MAG: hypothetical protein WAN74_07765 [Thermoplasmata archaeon]
MIVNGIDLIPCPQGHFNARPVPGKPGLGFCAVCGGSFDRSLPVRLDVLCQGHGEVGKIGRPGIHLCATVDEHLEWERSVMESGVRRSWFLDDRVGKGDSVFASRVKVEV